MHEVICPGFHTLWVWTEWQEKPYNTRCNSCWLESHDFRLDLKKKSKRPPTSLWLNINNSLLHLNHCLLTWNDSLSFQADWIKLCSSLFFGQKQLSDSRQSCCTKKEVNMFICELQTIRQTTNEAQIITFRYKDFPTKN